MECIVVFNGGAIDNQMLGWARRQPKTRCAVLRDGDKALATWVGRSMVAGEYFCFLDDDDEFRPGAFAAAMKTLQQDPGLDCLASNGIYITPAGARCVFANGRQLTQIDYAEGPLRSRNWLASCGGMFRTSTVGLDYFADLPRHREWTVIAFRIASRLNVRFVNRLSYRVFSSPASQSKRDSYIDAATESLEAMLRSAANPAHARAIRRQMSAANHYISSYYRIKGNFRRAWQAYRASIRTWSGLKYVPYATLLIARQTVPARALLGPVASALERWLIRGRNGLSLPHAKTRARTVAISGLPLFCSRLVQELNKGTAQWSLRVIKAETRLDVIEAFFTLLQCDLWYSIGEPVSDRRIEWFARLLNRKRAVHWVGSDVSVLQNTKARETFTSPRFTHLAEVDWMADELHAADLKAQIVPLPPSGTPTLIPALPEKFTVLLYVPRTRGDYYGLKCFERMMVSLAHLPIEYLIVGGGVITVPPNVRATNLGWRENLSDVYARSSVLVRFTPHDGLSLMVLEALAAGRHVLWTQPFPYCANVQTAHDIERQLINLLALHRSNSLRPQAEAAQMVRTQYSKSACLQKLLTSWAQSVPGRSEAYAGASGGLAMAGDSLTASRS